MAGIQCGADAIENGIQIQGSAIRDFDNSIG